MSRTVHPTKQLLIDTVSELLESKAPSELTSDEVITKSGISRGSLYHHFEDLSDLVAAAQVQRFSSMIDVSIEALTAVLLKSTSREAMLQGLRAVTTNTQAPARAKWRLERATALSIAGTNERMRKMLAVEQSRLTDAIADIVREAQEQGLFVSSIDPKAVGVLIQAYTLGKIVDDFVENPVDPAAWDDLIMLVIEKVFATPA